METRRTNQFLRVALGARSPGRMKLFKSKFHEQAAMESRLPLNASQQGIRQASTSYRHQRNDSGGPLALMQRSAEGGPRAATTKEGSNRRGVPVGIKTDQSSFKVMPT